MQSGVHVVGSEAAPCLVPEPRRSPSSQSFAVALRLRHEQFRAVGTLLLVQNAAAARRWRHLEVSPQQLLALLARFSGDTSILDAFCDAYGRVLRSSGRLAGTAPRRSGAALIHFHFFYTHWQRFDTGTHSSSSTTHTRGA